MASPLVQCTTRYFDVRCRRDEIPRRPEGPGSLLVPFYSVIVSTTPVSLVPDGALHPTPRKTPGLGRTSGPLVPTCPIPPGDPSSVESVRDRDGTRENRCVERDPILLSRREHTQKDDSSHSFSPLLSIRNRRIWEYVVGVVAGLREV